MKIQSLAGLTQIRKAWNDRGKMGDRNIVSIEREFLPAALEILETPPSPIGRILTWSIIAFFFIAIMWACFGHIDIVTTAQGKIIPSGRVKVIQPLAKGVVKAIHVKDYQYVEKGAPLIELDRTLTGADQTKLSEELAFTEATISRQKLFVKILNNPGKFTDLSRLYSLFPTDSKAGNHSEQVQLLYQQIKSYQSKREALSAELREKDAERRSSLEIIKQLEETLPLANKQFVAYKSLRDKNMVSDFERMEKEKAYIEQRQSLAAERAHQEQLAASVRSIEKEIQALDAEALRQALSDIQEAERQSQALKQELTKATELNAKQILMAPVSGEVQQLAVNTIGGVVTEAQPLMLIVPRGENLEAEVNVENKDIGFVKEGQKAEIKVNTFSFTRYGVIDAVVTDITKDAVETKDSAMDEKKALAFKMKLKLAKSIMMIDGKEVNLSPGMAVTAEVKTGKRKLIDFFLSPLIQHADESVRER